MEDRDERFCVTAIRDVIPFDYILAMFVPGHQKLKKVSPEEADQLVDDAVTAPADLFLKRTRQWIGRPKTAEVIVHLDVKRGTPDDSLLTGGRANGR